MTGGLPRFPHTGFPPEPPTPLPALNPVVDKLQADHEHIATLLGEAEAATQELAEPGAARDRLIAALAALSTDLLAHLAYEEEEISGTLRTFTRWPGW